MSRGVTFDNLLSMFFTRDVKHKIQQDTYVQRARMFGSRGQYLPFFELHIPEKLYLDWHRCFVFHRLSLESIRSGNGSPVWLEDTRVSAVAPGSIDRTTVAFNSGEMSFELFDYESSAIDKAIGDSMSSSDKVRELQRIVSRSSLPDFVLDYVAHFSPSGDSSIAIHPSRSIAGFKDANQERIERGKGFIGSSDLEREKYPHAVHHFKILYNAQNKARVFYKYDGSIRFLKNLGKKLDD